MKQNKYHKQDEFKIGDNIEFMNKISHFDVAEYLDDEEMIALYLNEALDQASQDNDYNLVIEAIADIVKARGMSKVASDAGI